MATWTQGTGDDFIAFSKEGWAKGVSILHFLGGISIDLAGDRAISQTKMTISQRCGRRGGSRWTCFSPAASTTSSRSAVEAGASCPSRSTRSDRMDPVTLGLAPALDGTLLEAFPVGYRHLAYLQTRIGYTVKKDMPGLKGPEVEALYARGAAWLVGKPL